MIKNKKIIAILISTCSLAACSTFFDKDNTPEPTPLTGYTQQASPRMLWSTKVGEGARGSDYLKMNPVINETALYTTSTTGAITSLNPGTGRKNWQTHVQLQLSSGPGVGDGLVVAGSKNGMIVALRESDGREAWRVSMPGEVIAPPAVGNGYVVVKAIDGYTRAYSSRDGSPLWSHQQIEPNLILRGSSAPLIQNHEVIAGYANGNIAKLGLSDGQLLWQQMAAYPQGAFAIQRMIDIDADPIVFDQHIYVATYQGRLSSLDWTTGRTLWSHDVSSYTGMTADHNTVYLSDAKGYVWGFDAENGSVNWRQDRLKYRVISGPANMGNFVVLGDAQGYLHWLNKSDGRIAARASVGSAIYAAPVVKNNVLYALTNNGYVAAYTLAY